MNKRWQTIKQWIGCLFSKKTAESVLIGAQITHTFIAWAVATIAMLASVYLIIASVMEFADGELIRSTTSAGVALLMILLCIAVDRYASSTPPTGGGKNP
jgi:uncharacterized membrane protein YjfL (UPF0719 family)